jgi:hypothetical protein
VFNNKLISPEIIEIFHKMIFISSEKKTVTEIIIKEE